MQWLYLHMLFQHLRVPLNQTYFMQIYFVKELEVWSQKLVIVLLLLVENHSRKSSHKNKWKNKWYFLLELLVLVK